MAASRLCNNSPQNRLAPVQVHPVVSRLCGPIEGTDSARLADCLGLDPSKFRGPPTGASAEEVREEALLASAASLDDDALYKVDAPASPFCVLVASRCLVRPEDTVLCFTDTQHAHNKFIFEQPFLSSFNILGRDVAPIGISCFN